MSVQYPFCSDVVRTLKIQVVHQAADMPLCIIHLLEIRLYATYSSRALDKSLFKSLQVSLHLHYKI